MLKLSVYNEESRSSFKEIERVQACIKQVLLKKTLRFKENKALLFKKLRVEIRKLLGIYKKQGFKMRKSPRFRVLQASFIGFILDPRFGVSRTPFRGSPDPVSGVQDPRSGGPGTGPLRSRGTSGPRVPKPHFQRV